MPLPNGISAQTEMALRAFAEEMPKACNQLSESNNRLIIAAKNAEDGLGYHSDEIIEVIQSIKNFVEKSAEPVVHMQQIMVDKADQIKALREEWEKMNNGGN